MRKETDIQARDIERFLQQSAVYLFHLRHLPRCSHRPNGWCGVAYGNRLLNPAVIRGRAAG